jgi:hypothetical protein
LDGFMKRWVGFVVWAGIIFPWMMGVYLFGWTASTQSPAQYGTYRPWLTLAFTYYGMAAFGLLAIDYLIKDDRENVYPSQRATMLIFHVIAMSMSLSLAYDKANCWLRPIWGCIG